MRRLALLLVCLAAGLAWAAGPYKVGDEAADAALAMSDGKDAKLSSLGGDAVLLYFYVPTLRHAGDEAKQVEALRKARAKQKLVVVGIARDAKPADAKKFADDNALAFRQAVDPKSELYAAFATKGVPWIAVLDARRKVKYSAAGIDEDAIDAALVPLLGPKDGADAKKDGDGKK